MPHPPFLDALDSDPEVAWRAFVAESSGLILAALGRYLPDPDLVMDGYLSVLESLRADGFRRLHRFVERTRADAVPFAAWLKLVSRNAALDLLRRSAGRRTEPEAIARRDPIDRVLFRCIYWDRLSYAEALEVVDAECDERLRIDDVAARADALHAALSRAGFRLSHHRRSAAARAASFDDADASPALEAEATAAALAAGLSIPRSPDAILEEAQHDGQIADLMSSLSQSDRALVLLRYGEGLQASEIAPLVGAGSAKAVYRRLDRLIEKLRERAPADLAPGTPASPRAPGAPRRGAALGESAGPAPSC